jgi:hypothetical protein
VGDDKRPVKYGDRNEDRKSKPLGVPIVPAGAPDGIPVPVGEFVSRPITNVNMTPTEELAARIERGRKATKSSELTITSRLDQQDLDTAELRSDVQSIDQKVDGVSEGLTSTRVEVANLRGDLVGGLGEVRGAMKGLETVVRDLGERKQMTFAADVKIQETKAVAAIEAPGHRWKFYAAAAALGAALFELLKAVFA